MGTEGGWHFLMSTSTRGFDFQALSNDGFENEPVGQACSSWFSSEVFKKTMGRFLHGVGRGWAAEHEELYRLDVRAIQLEPLLFIGAFVVQVMIYLLPKKINSFQRKLGAIGCRLLGTAISSLSRVW